MKPNSTRYQGRTYYFSVVLKEKNSDFMVNINYITVKIAGDIVDDDEDDDEEGDLKINKT